MLQEIILKNHETVEKLKAANQAELDTEGKGGKAERSSRLILHDGKYIVLWQKRNNVCDIIDYTPDLYSFLTRTECCTFDVTRKGRTMIGLSKFPQNGNPFRTTISRFLYYYSRYNIEADKFVYEFMEIERLAEGRPEIAIDHANDNHHIHCAWNLSPISLSQNSRKGTYLAGIKPPYFCFVAVTPENEYRIEFGYIAPPISQVIYIRCQTPEMLIDFLRSIFERFISDAELPPQLRSFGTPRYQRTTYSDKYYFSEDIGTLSSVAEKLLTMPESEFVIWSGEETWQLAPIEFEKLKYPLSTPVCYTESATGNLSGQKGGVK